jgi:hypothetical protein
LSVESLPGFDGAVLGVVPEPGRLDELHLYHGAWCNRTCTFCCVEGGPQGDHQPFTEEVLQTAVALVAPRGSLKIYGGEPTLDGPNLRWTLKRLRELGFAGAITIFSNGLRAAQLILCLESDPKTFAVLNFAIATGRGEKPLPRSASERLLAWAEANPRRLFLSHDFTVTAGRETESEATAGATCFRCWPTLTSRGQLHACPFAVTHQHAHFALGAVGDEAALTLARLGHFQHWIEKVLEPEAERRGQDACAVCTGGSAPAFAPLLALERRPRREPTR